MKKDIIKSLIAIKQSEIPFDVVERDIKLPIDRKKIIVIPGVRRCGKSTLMEIAINELIQNGVKRERILWLGFDDERLRTMTAEELDIVIASYSRFKEISTSGYLEQDKARLRKTFETYNQESAFPEIVLTHRRSGFAIRDFPAPESMSDRERGLQIRFDVVVCSI